MNSPIRGSPNYSPIPFLDACKPVGTGVVAMARRSAAEQNPFQNQPTIKSEFPPSQSIPQSDLAKVSK